MCSITKLQKWPKLIALLSNLTKKNKGLLQKKKNYTLNLHGDAGPAGHASTYWL